MCRAIIAFRSRSLQYRVYHPLTGAVVTNLTLDAGGEVLLPRGPGAYIIRGSPLDSRMPAAPGGMTRTGTRDVE